MKLAVNTLLILSLLFSPANATHRVYRNRVQEQVIIKQKNYLFNDYQTLQVIQVPITSYGPEYYYEAQPLRNRRVLTQEDIDAVTQSIISEFEKKFEVTNETGSETSDGAQTPDPTTPDQPGNPTELSLDDQVLALFDRRNCATCHAAGNEKNQLTLITEDGKMAELTDRQVSKIIDRTEAGFGLDPSKLMPKGGPPLPTEEIELLKRWQRERFSK